MLADEVGLGKTIEAGLVLAQRWAERRRRILIIVPATLRKQWAQELDEKFHIPTMVLESNSFNRLVKEGLANPFDQQDCVVICSYHFAANKSTFVASNPWDLVVVDEAHRLRNVYKKDNKMAQTLREALEASCKVLLTATPLQNSLMELYGLVSFIDPHVFGDEISFRDQFLRAGNDKQRNDDLKHRLASICHRTLRRQVLEYIKFTQRIPLTWEFYPRADEQSLYEEVSEYLQRDELFALPSGQRALMTMVLRKLLASSSFAIAGTLKGLVQRLEQQLSEMPRHDDFRDLIVDYETYDATSDEWGESDRPPQPSSHERALLQEEIDALKGYLKLANNISANSKGDALVEALKTAFDKTAELGGVKKAVIFTESQRTQAYLFKLLEAKGYAGKVVTINGTNTDSRSKEIYKAWSDRHSGEKVISGSRAVDVKAALVEEFRDSATILVATEAAAEGVNLQFCSLVVNYDLPWNPQRIEQRIGRCHRYGQKHDVVVVNFLNKSNAADQRVYELLDQKFHLFDGVFGSSDHVLGALESGVDIERRIAEIYQQCRSATEISEAFSQLQKELEGDIKDRMTQTRQVVLENFDEEVQERLRVHRNEARAVLDEQSRLLLALARSELSNSATFDEGTPRFHYQPTDKSAGFGGFYTLDWRAAEAGGENFFRTEHPLAQTIIDQAIARSLDDCQLVFDYAAYGTPVSILAERLGQAGWLRVSKVTVKAIEEEEHLLLVAIPGSIFPDVSTEQVLDADWCSRLLSLPAQVVGAVAVDGASDALLEEQISRQHEVLLSSVEARNGAYFEEEVDKLDRWAEDVKLTLERELKELDAEIRIARKDTKTRVALAEKLEAQRRIKTLEKRRTSKRRQLFEAQDNVDTQRNQLIEDIERQLKTSARCETLFTIRWSLPEESNN